MGFLHSKGKYLFFLDNDTYVYKCCIENLVEVLEKDPDIGIAQPKTLIMGNPKYINTTGGFINLLGEPHLRGYLERDIGQYNQINEILYAQGSGFIIRRDAFVRVGMYDPSYYIYYDDTDLSLRIWLSGYRVVYVPSAIISHKIGFVRKNNLKKIMYYDRNKVMTLLKNLGIGRMIFYTLLAMAYILIFRVLSAIKSKNPTVLAVTIRGFYWILVNLKKIIKKRYFIQHRLRKVTDDYLMCKGLLKGSACFEKLRIFNKRDCCLQKYSTMGWLS
jgi:GT2 family glycosyltransferase